MDNKKTEQKIPLIRPFMPSMEEYMEEISSLWTTRSLTNMGQKHRQLEEALKEYLGAANLQLFANGHGALECVLSAFQLKGEVITTPFTFASTIHAIVRCGLTPVFCDIRPDDFTLDAEKVERYITKKTAAILPVHVYGMACDVAAMEKIQKTYGLKVIYDAAHAFGVKVRGRGIASYGDASMFSFHATKLYHTVEGGAAAFQDETLAKPLTALKDFGLTGPETVDLTGCNSKLDEFRSAMGICNLRHIEEILKERQTAGMVYDKRLSGHPRIQILPQQQDVTRNYAYYPIVLKESAISRDQLQQKLMEHGVLTRKYFYPLCCDFPCYQAEYGQSDVPIARAVSDHVLCLPLFFGITEGEIHRVCDLIETWV